MGQGPGGLSPDHDEAMTDTPPDDGFGERDFPFSAALPTPPQGLRLGDNQHHGRGWVAAEDRWQRTTLGSGDLVHGFAVAYPRPGLGALYATDGTVWLQGGAHGWNCADILEVRQVTDRADQSAYDVITRDGGRERLTLQMSAQAEWQRRVDPVYDEIDSWSDDIVKTLPYTPRRSLQRPFHWMGSDGRTVVEWSAGIHNRWHNGVDHAG